MSNVTRRSLLQIAAATAVSEALGAPASASGETPQKEESYAQSTLYTRSPIELYINTLSAAPGDELTLHVSTTAQHFNVQIARVGLEETVVWTQEHVRGAFHPTPDDAWKRGCRWPVSVRLRIPATWKSGYYQIKAITAAAGTPNAEFLSFVVVRAAQPTSKVLVVLSTNTYGAYNIYGGASLYQKKGIEGDSGLSGTTGEHQVSFQRPWTPGFLWRPEGFDFDAEFSDPKNLDLTDHRYVNKLSRIDAVSCAAGFHNWERVMVRWLERNGYAVDCAVSSDLEMHPELLGRYHLMLTAGHDEYWSWGMRDTVESFVAQGGNVCFFSGDVAFWQVRFEENGRSMVCYKDNYREDPYFKSGKRHLATGYWSSHYAGRPETQLTGLSTWYGGFSGRGDAFPNTPKGGRGYVIYRPEHWVFEGSGLSYGDYLGNASGIVAYELDGCPLRMENGLPFPATFYDGPSSLQILGMIPASWGGSDTSPGLTEEAFGNANPKVVEYVKADHHHAMMSIYANNGTVFSAGTIDWTNGLTGNDPAVERITRNLIDRLSA